MLTAILICIDRNAADLDKSRDENRLFTERIINIASVIGHKGARDVSIRGNSQRS